MSGASLGFHQCLAADAAGTDGREREIFSFLASGNGDGSHGNVRLVCVGIEQGGALGTGARSEGGILLVATANRLAVVKKHGGAHAEVRVGGVGCESGLACLLRQVEIVFSQGFL